MMIPDAAMFNVDSKSWLKCPKNYLKQVWYLYPGHEIIVIFKKWFLIRLN